MSNERTKYFLTQDKYIPLQSAISYMPSISKASGFRVAISTRMLDFLLSINEFGRGYIILKYKLKSSLTRKRL